MGNSRLLLEQGIDNSSAQSQQRELEKQGLTVVLVSHKHKTIGLMAIGDAIKEDAPQAIAKMKNKGLEPVMVTGDNWRTARAVADQVGISEVLAEVLPGQKAEAVRRLQGKGYRVAMVGDGINDAPALMQADVGIAIGTGTDIAIESADIVLIGSSLDKVLDAYHIAKNSFTKTVQNVVLAFTFNGLGIPVAMTGLLHPAWAMLAMAASVTVVLINSFGGKLLPAPSAKREEIKTHTLKLNVPTMHCEGCEQVIRDAVLKVKGVEAVEIDLGRKLVSVTLRDGDITKGKIRRQIVKADHTIVANSQVGHVHDSREGE